VSAVLDGPFVAAPSAVCLCRLMTADPFGAVGGSFRLSVMVCFGLRKGGEDEVQIIACVEEFKKFPP